MSRTTVIILIALGIACGACREIPTGPRAVFSGDSSPAGVRAMTQKCRKIKTGMSRTEVETILGFAPCVHRAQDGTEIQEWSFGGGERDGGCMTIVYAADGRVTESRLERW